MKNLIFLTLCLSCSLLASGQDYLKQANDCFDKGDYECAKKNYSLFKDFDGSKDVSVEIQKSDECYKTLIVADDYFKDKEYGKARDRYKTVLDKNPKDAYAKKQYDQCRMELPATTLRVAPLKLIFQSQGGIDSIKVSTNADNYYVDSLPGWCSVINKQSDGFSIKCDSLDSSSLHEGYFDVKAGGKSERISVTQLKDDYTETAKSLNLKMIYVKGGTFTMGCTPEQGNDCNDNEKPAHQVTVSNFYIGKYEVTQAQWKAIMGVNPSPSNITGDNLPVSNVSWMDVQEFIHRLNELTGKQYRLPTEAEWEYACRGGLESAHYKYSGSNTANNVAWYSRVSYNIHFVGTRSPNELGIYDMSGNVWEWCNDWYGPYSSDVQTDPQGPSIGPSCVLRGGSYSDSNTKMRVSARSKGKLDSRKENVGFRLACSSN